MPPAKAEKKIHGESAGSFVALVIELGSGVERLRRRGGDAMTARAKANERMQSRGRSRPTFFFFEEFHYLRTGHRSPPVLSYKTSLQGRSRRHITDRAPHAVHKRGSPTRPGRHRRVTHRAPSLAGVFVWGQKVRLQAAPLFVGATSGEGRRPQAGVGCRPQAAPNRPRGNLRGGTH